MQDSNPPFCVERKNINQSVWFISPLLVVITIIEGVSCLTALILSLDVKITFYDNCSNLYSF